MDTYKNVTVTYDGSRRIVVKGEQIKFVLFIDQSELASVYMGNEGSGKLMVSDGRGLVSKE